MNTVANAGKNPFRILMDFASSSVGSKMLVALTGIAMWGFVIGHMVGHLQMYLPAPEGGYWGQQINEYAHFLKTTPALLWGTRIGLLGAVALHIMFTVRLYSQNQAARPVGYAAPPKRQKSTIFSRIMPYSGMAVFLFIILHLMHFTIPLPNVDLNDIGMAVRERPYFGFFQASTMGFDTAGLPNVYNSVRASFSHIGWVAVYVIGNLLLLMHLVHGSQSVWQSLGLHNKKWSRIATILGRGIVAFIGAVAIPMPFVLYAWYHSGSTL